MEVIQESYNDPPSGVRKMKSNKFQGKELGISYTCSPLALCLSKDNYRDVIINV